VGSGCTSDLDCNAPQVCDAGVCVPPPDCSGPACPCGDGGACPVGESCAAGRCNPIACGGELTSCPAGFVCTDGICVRPDAGCGDAGCGSGAGGGNGGGGNGGGHGGCVDGGVGDAGCGSGGGGGVGTGSAGGTGGGSTGSGGGTGNGVGGGGCADGGVAFDGGCCTPQCSAATCGQPDGCGGTCPACCTPQCTDATCGQSDGCGGTCPACCYQCVTGSSSCSLATVAMDGGACPAGYSATQPACSPCWSCRNYGIAYCTSASCCGPWTTTGVVGGGCTCYSNGGVPGVSTLDENDACYQSQLNTIALQSNQGGWGPWPSGANDVSCGYDGNSSGIPYSPPVAAGGCATCSFTCGGACCLPYDCISSGNQCSVSTASQCCSGQVGTCFGGTGSNCCQ
jgi:hypothetical protein